jgi:ABC-type polysaccharide/polyol phosphate export permease
MAESTTLAKPTTLTAAAGAPTPDGPSVTFRSGGEAEGHTDGLLDIARDVWRSRELVLQLTMRDIRIRYKQAVMGFGWAVLMPMLVVVSGIVIRYAMAQTSGSKLTIDLIGAMAVKALPWAFFVGAIGLATTSLISNTSLLTKIYFPREVLPLSSTLAQSFDTSIGAVALLLMLPWFGASLTVQLLWVPLLLALLFTFVLGCTVFLSCANLFFRDVKYIVQVLLMFGIFVTPVFYEVATFGPVGARVLMLNPLAPILEGLRLAIFQGHDLLRPLVELDPKQREVLAWSPWYLAYTAVWAVGLLTVSVKMFRRAASTFAEWV